MAKTITRYSVYHRGASVSGLLSASEAKAYARAFSRDGSVAEVHAQPVQVIDGVQVYDASQSVHLHTYVCGRASRARSAA